MTRAWPREVAEPGTRSPCTATCTATCCGARPRHASDDIRRAYDTVADATGVEPRWFRPPFGISSYASLRAARGLGMTTVLWTTWGRDWRREATPDRLFADVTRRYLDGGTVLLHDSDCTSYPGSWRSPSARLPRLADEFAARAARGRSRRRARHRHPIPRLTNPRADLHRSWSLVQTDDTRT